MEIRVLKEDEHNLEIEVSGIDQSLLQIVQQELLTNNNVEFAAFNKPHPLLKTQTLSLIVKSGNPRNVFREACEQALGKARELQDAIYDSLSLEGELKK